MVNKLAIILIALINFNLFQFVNSSEITECDIYAGSKYDDNNPFKEQGIEIDDIDSDLAIKACERILDQNKNDPRVLFQLARAYEKKDINKSINFYLKSAKIGYPISYYNLGLIYYYDIEDVGLSNKYLQLAIDKGLNSGYANYFIALNYWFEDIEYDLAEKQLILAIDSTDLDDAELGDAYYRLGWYKQFKGDGIEAVNYFLRALDYIPDDITTLNHLAYLYSEGFAGVPQNMSKSIYYLNKTADLGSSLAANNLAHHYEVGLGVEQDFFKAFDYYKKSYEIGTTALAYTNLAYLYINGYGTEKNPQKAIQVLVNLKNTFEEKGYDYFEEENSSIDDTLSYATDLISELSNDKEKNDTNDNYQWAESDICNDIEINLESGANQDQVFQKCLFLAEKGDENAISAIAYAYLQGLVVKRDYQKAYYWYSKLNSDWGRYQSTKLLVYGYALDDQIDIIQILDRLISSPQEASVDSNYVYESKFLKAILFRHGIGKERDLDLATKYLNEIISAELGENSLVTHEIASTLLNEIKSIKSGYQVENDYSKYFPATFSGIFSWNEIDAENQIISNIQFDKLEKIGPFRYKIMGSLLHENGVTSEINGFLDSRKNNFLIRQSNPTDPESNTPLDYHIDGDYIGFFDNEFYFATAHYIPDNTGAGGYLKLTRTSESEVKKVEKLNLNFGNYYALIIGNNNYEENINLDTAILDAEAVANVLEKKYGFQIIKLIKDGSRKEILSSLNQLKTQLQRGDNLLIYYAGHGYYDNTNRGYWLPVDAAPLESEDTTQWISSDDIVNIMAKVPSNHILVIADSCFSGALTTRGSHNLSVEDRTNLYKNLIQKKSRKALTSGALEPVLDGGGEGHSVFADSFLRILSENMSVLDTTTLYNRVYKEVASVADQSPQYGVVQKTGDEGGDFIFVPIY